MSISHIALIANMVHKDKTVMIWSILLGAEAKYGIISKTFFSQICPLKKT